MRCNHSCMFWKYSIFQTETNSLRDKGWVACVSLSFNAIMLTIITTYVMWPSWISWILEMLILSTIILLKSTTFFFFSSSPLYFSHKMFNFDKCRIQTCLKGHTVQRTRGFTYTWSCVLGLGFGADNRPKKLLVLFQIGQQYQHVQGEGSKYTGPTA